MVSLFGIAMLGAAACRAGDSWPQFRGPDGQGHADAADLPTTWSDTENVAWKTPIPGRGWSSPVIQGNIIWLTTATGDGHSLRAISIDRATGRILHDVEVFSVDKLEAINAKNSYASPTPVIDGDRVFVHFGTYGTAALKVDTGEILWSTRDFPVDHKEGAGSSPIVSGDLLIFHCDGIDVQYVAALDKRTGRTVWKAERSAPKNANPDFRKAYCTPLLIDVAGQQQIISIAADRAYAYDPSDGSELWFIDFTGFSNVPRPLYSKGVLFLDTGYMKPQLWAVRPQGRGNVTATHVMWRVTAQVPANSSPIVVGDELFMVSDQGVLSCLDTRTGKEHFKTRLGGNFSASPISASGRIYFFAEDGQTTVIEAAKQLHEMARIKLPERIMASPAVAGNAMYLRTEGHLYRIEQPIVAAKK